VVSGSPVFDAAFLRAEESCVKVGIPDRTHRFAVSAKRRIKVHFADRVHRFGGTSIRVSAHPGPPRPQNKNAASELKSETAFLL